MTMNEGKTYEEIQKYLMNFKPKSINEQVNILCHYFPNLETESKALRICQFSTLGLVVIPTWIKLAPSYKDAVQFVLTQCKINIKLDLSKIRQSSRKITAINLLKNTQKNSFLVLPVKLHQFMNDCKWIPGNEFRMGIFEIIILILSHQELLSLGQIATIYFNCEGDEYVDQKSICNPCICLNESTMHLDQTIMDNGINFVLTTSGLIY